MKHSGMCAWPERDGTVTARRRTECRAVTARASPPPAPPRAYESHYLRAADPARPRGVDPPHRLKRPGGPPTGALWCTAVTPRPARRTRSSSRCRARAPALARPRPSHFGPAGAAAAPRRTAAGRVGASLRPPRRAAAPPPPPVGSTDAPLPRTKLESPLPDAVFSGWVEADGQRGRSTAGAGWSATTGAPSTPSAGSGCTAPASTRRRTRGSMSRSAACGRPARRRGSPTARSRSTASGSGSAASAAPATRVDARPGGGTIEVSGVRIEVRACAARPVALLRPSRRRAPQHELLDRGQWS